MKKILLGCISLCLSLVAMADITTPDFYMEDFVKMSQTNDYPTDGWLTTGNGAMPTPYCQHYFGNGTGSSYILLNYGSQAMALACTDFVDPDVTANQWLISPEIEMPYENACLFFKACIYNANGAAGVGTGKYNVLVSEGGTAPEDFKTTIISEGSIRGAASDDITMRDVVCQINGFKGKKIRLGFQVIGKDTGLVGFTAFRMGQYIMNITNYTPEVCALNDKITIYVNAGLKAPVDCPYLDCDLQINGAPYETMEYKKAFGTASNSLMFQAVKSTKPYVVADNEPVNYKLTLTPRFEGAVPSVVTGTFGVPSQTYINNVVVEECTATGCQGCPSGIASLEYYMDTYPGTETEGKAIPIAIHTFMNYEDPMMQGVAGYCSAIMQLNATTSLPQAIFNRNTSGLMPEKRSWFEKQLSTPTYNWCRITGVDKPEGVSAEDMPGKTITVNFDVKNAYSTVSRNISAAIVLLENNVRGNNMYYSQTNGFYTEDEKYINDVYGSFLLPYMKKYLAGGELGVNMIPFSKMTYQHVARMIYPDTFGEALNSEWVADVPQSYSVDITIPDYIHNFDETEVVVLILNNDNDKRQIVASDTMEAAHYTSGVENAVASANVIAKTGNRLYVKGIGGEIVNVYAADGRVLASGSLAENGELFMDASAWQGVVIVKAGADSRKLIF